MQPITDDTVADGPPQTPPRSPLSRWGWLVAAVASALITALVMYFVMRPSDADEATPPVADASAAQTTAPSEAPSPTAVPTTPAPAEAPSPAVEPTTPVPATTEPAPEAVASDPVASPESAAEEETSGVVEPVLDLRWVDVGATISEPGQVGILAGGPPGFADYVASIAGQVDDWGCTNTVDVYAMHPKGFVIGGLGSTDCGGGANVVWSSQNGQWAPLFEMQDLLSCQELIDAGVPENSGQLECYDGDQVWWY